MEYQTTTMNSPHQQPEKELEQDDDPYNLRIEKTGCAQENEDLQLCFYDKRDWRLCKDEMQRFRQCFTAKSSNAGSRELKESEQEQEQERQNK